MNPTLPLRTGAFEEAAVLVRRMRPSSSAFSVRERSETPVRS